jgi:hypothetical protein
MASIQDIDIFHLTKIVYSFQLKVRYVIVSSVTHLKRKLRAYKVSLDKATVFLYSCGGRGAFLIAI